MFRNIFLRSICFKIIGDFISICNIYFHRILHQRISLLDINTLFSHIEHNNRRAPVWGLVIPGLTHEASVFGDSLCLTVVIDVNVSKV